MGRVVVVGAGLGGMAAAARLAKQGHEVTVCERAERPGGALARVHHGDFGWDAGPASTTLPATLRDLFRKSGRPLERELQLRPLAPGRRHRFSDGTELDLPAGSRADQLDTLAPVLGGSAAQQWTELLDGLAPVWNLLRRAALDQPFAGCRALDRATRRALAPRRSLRRLAEGALTDPRLRAMLQQHAVLQGSDPRRTPGFVAVESYLERTFGLWRPDDGMAALGDALARRLRERRVELRLGAAVQQVHCTGGAVSGVRLADGSELSADIVVGGIEPRRFFRMLVGCAQTAAMLRTVDRTAAAVPPALTHLGLADDPAVLPRLPVETVLHGDPMLVVHTGGRAPAGRAAWTVLCRGSAGEDVLDVLAHRGLDVRASVVLRVDRRPDEVAVEPGGSSYGVAWDGWRTTSRRPGPTTPVAGLYCVGASAHPGAGVPLVATSAALVAEQVGRA